MSTIICPKIMKVNEHSNDKKEKFQKKKNEKEKEEINDRFKDHAPPTVSLKQTSTSALQQAVPH